MNNNYKITYIRVKNSNAGHRGDPIGCIASYVTGVKDEQDRQVLFAISVVNSRENFDKKMARKIAVGRLEVSNFERRTVTLPEKFTAIEVTYEIMKNITINLPVVTVTVVNGVNGVETEVRFPNRAQQAAKVWCRDYEKRRSVTP